MTFKNMTQYREDNELPLTTRKAANRLSGIIQLDSMLRYAATIRDPDELKVIRKMISDIGLRSRCRKADIVELTTFIDTLLANLYRPAAVNQYNTGCQQFYGPIDKSEFETKNINRKKK